MKNNYLKVLSLAIAAIVFASCAKMKIKYYGKKVEKVESIALFSTMIGKIQQPFFPVLSSAIFNEKTNAIADQIIDLQKRNIDNCREIVALSLKKNFNCKILYADSLHALAGFAELKRKFDFKNSLRYADTLHAQTQPAGLLDQIGLNRSLRSENDFYPLIITAKDDINPFQFKKGDVPKYFYNSANYKAVIAELGKKTNTDLIAVSYSALDVTAAGRFGITWYGDLQLYTCLLLFDKEGDMIASAYTYSKPTRISGEKIEKYKEQLDKLQTIFEPMMNKVIVKFPTKK